MERALALTAGVALAAMACADSTAPEADRLELPLAARTV
jgi:hypothetical protein